ncbi:hypothetical protein J6590_038851 [Homalodisca vitripennis]|nr:hypothetical protein J6590_038851 [Homalodisca vitripennis]
MIETPKVMNFRGRPRRLLALWGSCAQHKLERVFRLQKSRKTNSDTRESCRNAFKELGLLTLLSLHSRGDPLLHVEVCFGSERGCSPTRDERQGQLSRPTTQDKCVQKLTIPNRCQIDQ